MTAALHIAETTENQRAAADPSLSAFVSANAGSGKTRVLTNRVARLLLEDIDPSTILCITFTKAAAAEMAERLFKLLGEWALADDAKLQEKLSDLDGDARIRAPKELARARRLFARALETPGGLKIQTIHSFCEGILKRFPLEAGAPPGFAVIEEIEARRLKKEAVGRVAQADDAATINAFARLLGRMSGFSLRALVEGALAGRRKFARAFEIGWTRLGEEIAMALGADGASAKELTAALIAGLQRDRLEDACAALDASGGNPQRYCAAPLKKFFAAGEDEERLAALTALFLDSEGRPRGKFGTKATEKIDASIEGFLFEAQVRFLEGIDRIRAADAAEDTRAFLMLVERAFAEYDAAKRMRAMLDFDDLIEKTRTLFRSDGGAQWVLYKLDKGLSHILLDEAQDTGPDAWDVVEAPLEEFFAGSGVRETARTFFAVGDQKQSIYSFQGADAALFNEKEKDLGKKIGAVQTYANVPLKASFRTTAPVLEFVDALFARDEVIENVSVERPLSHQCTREGEAGYVELWPLVKKAEREKPNPWDAPLDAAPADNPSRRLAREIADLIAGWLRDGEILQSQGRSIEPGDIMILVQSRGALFSEIIRALGAARVPVAGADKIALTDDQGVLDLLSFARTALFDGDDLSLAETLKSPFFNIDEESLFDLAADRGGETLWRALEFRRDERADWRSAHDEIERARRIALEEGAASFFTHILEAGAPSGWRRLAERLGKPSREPIEEFLRQAHEFEMRNPRSLRLFLDAIVKSGAEVSRDAAEAGPMVRVLTAHKAKGLEANIVFLIDAHRNAQVGKVGSLMMLSTPDGVDIPALALGGAARNSTLAAARDRAKSLMRDEYRRLLYVAATRARDRLYVCGVESGRGGDESAKPPAEKSWRALAEDAFSGLGARIEDAGERFEGRARRLSSAQTAAPKAEKKEIRFSDARPDDFLFATAPKETRARSISPSRLFAEEERDESYSPLRGRDPFLRGRILHRLLEILPGVEPAARGGAANRLLSYHAREFDEAARNEMRREAFRVLDDPQFADVFAPNGLAEAAIGGTLADGLSLLGQIDRLAVLEDRVLVVDYKTNRPPPKKVENVPRAYLGQMAAYRAMLRRIWPGKRIESALLWTYDARLMPLPDDVLDHAEAQILTLA